MLDTIKKEYKVLAAIFCLFLLNLFFFWLKQGSIGIDTGRELYIPWQMLKGQVLYKDIFNIYGPLSYQINALAYLLLGQKISSLVAFGAINSFVALISLYFISREFLDKVFSFLIVSFVMYSSVFLIGLFNFNLPYSYAMPYSFSAFLLAVLFLIKYVKKPDSTFAYLSCFFAGISVACKYDYLFFPLLIIYVVGFLKPLGKKQLLMSAASFFFVPLVSYGILFFQGLSFHDLWQTFLSAQKMSQCSSLHYLYTMCVGTYFNPQIFFNVVKKFLPLLAWFSLLLSLNYWNDLNKNKSLKSFLETLFFLLTLINGLFFIRVQAFGVFPVLCCLLIFVFCKQIYSDKAVLILAIAAVLGSLKTFFALYMFSYGAYTIPLLLLFVVVFLVVILSKITKNEKLVDGVKKSTKMLLISFVIIIALAQYSSLSVFSSKLSTPKGSINNYPDIVETYNVAIDYILQNTKETDKIIIWPETPFINFVTNRDSDNYYLTLIPLYVELFGEQSIIGRLEKTKPEYIIFNNRDTSDYGLQYICKDYALGVCSYVNEKYTSVKIIGKDYKMLIYKRKDLK